MKGRLVGTLFALPFLAVGAWMLWSIGSGCYDGWRMSRWQPAEARLLEAGYRTSNGDDSETYQAYARYTYEYGGRTYTGDRASISREGDNIGDFQRDLGNRLSSAMARDEPITVRVNPAFPAESVVDRSIRWGLAGFKSIFLLVFGGIGFGLLIAVWRAPKARDGSLAIYQESPWLLNEEWQTASVRSDSRTTMWGSWAFAAFWNLISAPLPFLIYEEIETRQNHLAMAGLLFPLVGIGLLVWAIRRTLEWRRFGATPVVLDPYPGSIGGHVGGTIETRIPFDSRNRFLAILTCLHCYESGSGDDRSKHEKAVWQAELVAHSESGASGTRLKFRFDVPAGLRESDAVPNGDGRNVWRLNLHADLPDTNLDRSFDIPVYATARRSRALADRDVARTRAAGDSLFDEAVRKRLPVRFDGMRKKLVYPMGRHAGANLAGLIVGATFAAAGAYIAVEKQMFLFGAVFGGAGLLVVLVALYLLLNSLEVSQQGDEIRTVRRWLGIPIRVRRMRRGDFRRFGKASGMQTRAGGRHVVYYTLRAIDCHGNELILGEGFRGEADANAAIRYLSGELGLVASESAARRNRGAGVEEFANGAGSPSPGSASAWPGR